MRCRPPGRDSSDNPVAPATRGSGLCYRPCSNSELRCRRAVHLRSYGCSTRMPFYHSDSIAVLFWVFNQLPILELLLYFIPENGHFTCIPRRRGAEFMTMIGNNVMERNQPPRPHQGAIEFKIGFDALVGMIAVNEKKI